MCLFTTARTFAIVFARSAGSEAMYCAGVVTFDGGFMDSSSSRTKCTTERFENAPWLLMSSGPIPKRAQGARLGGGCSGRVTRHSKALLASRSGTIVRNADDPAQGQVAMPQ